MDDQSTRQHDLADDEILSVTDEETDARRRRRRRRRHRHATRRRRRRRGRLRRGRRIALRRCSRAVAPVDAERFLAEHWERSRSSSRAQRRAVRRPPLRAGRRAADHRDGAPHARRSGSSRPARRVSGYTTDLSWRPAPFTGVADVRRVLAEFEAGATIVLQGLHHSWLPLARYCRAARGVPRPPRPGERVLHAAGLAGAAGPPRHARGLLAPGRGREAVARLRARARAAAEGPALPLGARRARRAGARRHARAPATRSTCRAAGCTRRSPRAPTRCTSPSASTSAAGSTRRARCSTRPRTTSSCAARSIDGAEPPELPALDADGGRAARAASAFVRTRRPILDGQLSELRALDSLTRGDGARAASHGDRRPRRDDARRSRARPALPGAARGGARVPRHDRRAVPRRRLPGTLDEAGRLVLVRRLVREGFLRRSCRGRLSTSSST